MSESQQTQILFNLPSDKQCELFDDTKFRLCYEATILAVHELIWMKSQVAPNASN